MFFPLKILENSRSRALIYQQGSKFKLKQIKRVQVCFWAPNKNEDTSCGLWKRRPLHVRQYEYLWQSFQKMKFQQVLQQLLLRLFWKAVLSLITLYVPPKANLIFMYLLSFKMQMMRVLHDHILYLNNENSGNHFNKYLLSAQQ